MRHFSSTSMCGFLPSLFLPVVFVKPVIRPPFLVVDGVDYVGAVGPLDELFDVIRSSMMASHLEALTRMYLLQLLELRAGGWQTDETRSNFYKHKCRGLAVKVSVHLHFSCSFICCRVVVILPIHDFFRRQPLQTNLCASPLRMPYYLSVFCSNKRNLTL